MNHTSDAPTAENGGDFDLQQAAALLDQTTQRARRTFAEDHGRPDQPGPGRARRLHAVAARPAQPL